MSLFGGITRSLFNPMTIAQLAMGPAGWASLAMRTIGSQIAMNVIQQLGQKMGLPQSMISLAQGVFAQASGQPGLAMQSMGQTVGALGEQFGLSPQQQGDLTRTAEQAVKDIAESLFAASRDGKTRASTEDAKSGKNFLRVIAEAMAKSMDKKVGEMSDLAQAYDKQSKDNKSTKTMTDLQVATQEFSYLMQSTTNMIKTIGEGLSTAARKG